MESVVQWVLKEFRLLAGIAPRPVNEDYDAFDRVNGHTLDYREFRRSTSLSTHPSLVADFAETEAGCTYSWAPIKLPAKP